MATLPAVRSPVPESHACTLTRLPIISSPRCQLYPPSIYRSHYLSYRETMSGARAPDFFYREAQRLGYVARFAFKLLQMQNQYKFITPGAPVLYLGCAPGASLQLERDCRIPIGLFLGEPIGKNVRIFRSHRLPSLDPKPIYAGGAKGDSFQSELLFKIGLILVL